MKAKYYPNEGNECFRSSLANLLIEMGDPATAELAYNNYSGHPFTKSGHIGISTRLVRDLTESKYGATMVWHPNVNLEKATREYFKERAQDILMIINEEMFKRNLSIKNGKTNFKEPFMYEVSNATNEISHWLVAREDGLDINDGVVMRYPIEFVSIDGVLKVYSDYTISHMNSK